MSDTLVTGGHPPDELLTAFAHGEGAPADRNEVARHLEHCPECAREVTIMEAIQNEVKSLTDSADAPATLRGRILSRIGSGTELPRRFTILHVVQWASAGAFVLILAAIFFPVFAQSREAGRRASPARDGYHVFPSNADTLGGRPQSAPATTAGVPAARTFADGHAKSAPGGGAAAGRMFAQDYDEPSQGQLDTGLRRNGSPYVNLQSLPHIGVPGVTPDDIKKYTHGKPIEDVKRKVAQGADMGVRVNRKLEELQDDITARIKGQGGFVETADLNSLPNAERTMSMALRVPVESFDKTVTWLSGLGEVTSKNTKGEDITGTWVNQRSTLRELRKEEIRLAGELDAARTAALRNELRNRILNLRIRIDQAESAFAYTSKLAALSTIRLTLTEEPQARIRGSIGSDTENMFRSAVSAFMVAVRVPLAIAIWLLVFTPLWLPCVLAYRWATRKLQTS